MDPVIATVVQPAPAKIMFEGTTPPPSSLQDRLKAPKPAPDPLAGKLPARKVTRKKVAKKKVAKK